MIIFCISLWLVFLIPSADCLECLSCHEVDDEALCSTTQTCNQSQSCYRSDKMINNKLVITEGCIDKHKCGVGVVDLIGRDVSLWTKRQTDTCFECCSSDQCNSALCQHQKPSSCIDDALMDCSRMSSLFSICTDVQHAKTVCPKFCGLCNLVDGGWTIWSGWTQCPVTCNQGIITRHRLCTNPAPANGGLNCSGDATESQQCLTATPCPIDGNWSEWGAWGTCSVSCEIGIQTRDRTCSNPKPDNHGNHCFGRNTDSKLCNNGPCTDGGWSAWSAWSNCSSKCRIGIKTQFRTCTSPKPSPHGKSCVGSTVRVDTCRDFTECSYADCSEIKQNEPDVNDGIFYVTLWKTKRTIKVYCDMTTEGGGWTVFQNRYDGHVDFYQNFTEYENGFGNLNNEFWLGLDYIEEMTSRHTTQLRIDLVAYNGSTAYEVLDDFFLSPGPQYNLHFGNTSSSHNIGSSYRLSYNKGQAFSTYDHDVDGSGGHCAVSDHGAWWYFSCTYTNLNGQYLTQDRKGENGMIYGSFIYDTPLKQSKMAFRGTRT